MNYWLSEPSRDEVLDKIYDFLKLLSENNPTHAEQLVRVGSMPKFRDALHYHLTDYAVMIFDDKQYMQLPDDFSVGISNPYDMDENDIEPRFSGTDLQVKNNEIIKVRVGIFKEITPVVIHFMVYKLENKFFLNLMKVERE